MKEKSGKWQQWSAGDQKALNRDDNIAAIK